VRGPGSQTHHGGAQQQPVEHVMRVVHPEGDQPGLAHELHEQPPARPEPRALVDLQQHVRAARPVQVQAQQNSTHDLAGPDGR
jgi:hypothetical protein